MSSSPPRDGAIPPHRLPSVAVLGLNDVARSTNDQVTFAEMANQAARPPDMAAVARGQEIARLHSYERLVGRVGARVTKIGCLYRRW
jgi:hypothetical protein